jgi:hypothetical protein
LPLCDLRATCAAESEFVQAKNAVMRYGGSGNGCAIAAHRAQTPRLAQTRRREGRAAPRIPATMRRKMAFKLVSSLLADYNSR